MPAALARRRSTRVASLARFRYREDGDSSEEDTTRETEREDDYASGIDDESSSLSELSFGSDIEDAIAPRKRTTKKTAPKRTSARVVTPPPMSERKRKRADTVATTPNGRNVLVLPSHKKKILLDAAAAAAPVAADYRQAKREIKDEEQRDSDDDDDGNGGSVRLASIASPPKRRVRKPARVVTTKKKPRIKGEDGDDDGGGGEEQESRVEPPSDWEEVYALVKAMRLPPGPAAHAAVDTMGCERLAAPDASPKDKRFHTLVALMLSSQTKDTVNAVVMARLQTQMPPYTEGAPAGLNLQNMLAIDPPLLNQLIWQVGFHNNKTKYLKQAAEILRDQWDGDIPNTAEGLMALPGVGPKMAYLCLAAEHGWNRVEGIGVDVHVHRITNLWGWQGKAGSPASKTPEATRQSLQSWLPHDKWKEINWLLVGFGQSVCLPQGAKCGVCTVGLRGLCPKADRKKIAEGRKRLAQQQAEEEEGKPGEVIKG